MSERRQRAGRDEDVARMHERAALFFELLERRGRAEAERALARRARLRQIDSSRERPGEDDRLERAS